MKYPKNILNKTLKILAGGPASTVSFRKKVELAEKSTDAVVLAWLSHDLDPDIRHKVATNKNSPIEILMELSQDVHPYVRQGVASNPKAPDSVKNKLEDVIDFIFSSGDRTAKQRKKK